MARISTYAVDGQPVSSDKLIGTDSSGTTTKNYPLGSVSDWLKESGASAVLGQNNYSFQIALDPDAGRLPGSFSFENYSGDGTEFLDISRLMVSKSSSTGKYVGDYLLSIVGDRVMLGQLDDLNSFGVYTLVSLVQSPIEPTFYDAELLFVEGNGALLGNKLYGLATYSASANPESAVWGSIEGTVTNQTDLVNYIDAEIAAIPVPATPTLQTVTDEGNTTTNNIGIGTATPGAKLDVNGTTYLRSVALNTVFGYSGNNIQFINTGNTTFAGNVGIGTTAPAAKLEVHQSADSQGLKIVGFDNEDNSNLHLFVDNFGNGKINSTEFLQINAGGSSRYRTTGYLRLEVGGTSNQLQIDYNYIKFTSGGTETMRITPGKVGIGTTAPTDKLEVVSSDNIGTTKIVSAVSLSGSQRTSLGYNSVMGSHSLSLVSQASDLTLYTKTARPIVFNTNNTEVARITDTGNVGIGTTAPTRNLEIAAQDGAYLRLSSANTNTSTGALIGSLEYKSSDSDSPRVVSSINSIIKDVYGRSADLIFSTAQTNQNNAERMRITDTGNVGIGTTAPALQSAGTGLHINAPTSSEIKFTNSTTGTTASDGTALVSNGVGFTINNRESGYLSLKTNNSTRLYINSAGNVGIGTTAPSGKLHVKGGNIRIDSNSSAGQNLQFRNNGAPNALLSNTYNILGGSSSTTDFNTYVYGDNSYSLWTNNTNRLSVSGSGKVGIGTTAPGKALDIRTNSPGDGLRLATSENAPYAEIINGNSELFPYGKINLRYGPTSTAGIVALSNSMELSGGYTTAGYIRFRSHVTEVMRMTNVGLGVGTTAPDTKLHVATSTSGGAASVIIQDNVRTGTDVLNYIGLTDSAASTQAKIGYLSTLNGDLSFSNLIGATRVSSTGQVILDASSNMLFNTGGSTSVKILNTGNVGIGTTAPTAKLEVIPAALNQNILSLKNIYGTTGFDFSHVTSPSEGLMMSAGQNTNLFIKTLANGADEGIKFLNSSDTELLTILKDGNVGIGTDSPSAKLEVSGSKTITSYSPNEPVFISIKPNVTDNNSSNNTKQEFLSIEPNYTFNYGSGGGTGTPKTGVSIKPVYRGVVGVNNDANAIFALYSKPTFDSNVRHASHYGIYLDSPSYSNTGNRTYYPIYVAEGTSYFGGNVGIGTTAPTGKLHIVNGNARIENNSASITFKATSASQILFEHPTTTGILGRVYYDATSNYMGLWTGNTERMRIASSGNVGIGTTTPESELTVNGYIQVPNGRGITFSDIGDGNTNRVSIVGSEDSDTMFFKTDNSVRMAFASGNVGIGTTAPDVKLQVVGQAQELGNSFNGLLYLKGTNALASYDTANKIVISSNGSSDGLYPGGLHFTRRNFAQQGNYGSGIRGISVGTVLQDNALELYTSTNTERNATRLKITSTGNVGIGTTAPSYPFVVKRTGSNVVASFEGDQNTYLRIARTGTQSGETQLRVTNNGSFNIASDSNISLTTGGVAGTNRLYIRNTDGNVGIGTTAPAYKLDVNGDARVDSYLRFSSAGTYLRNNSSGALVLAANSGYIETGWGARFRVRAQSGSGTIMLYGGGDSYINGGNLGIGTTAPNSKVHISGTAMQQLRMETAGGPSSAGDTSGRIGDMAYDDNYFYIKTANGWGRMALDFGF